MDLCAGKGAGVAWDVRGTVAVLWGIGVTAHVGWW